MNDENLVACPSQGQNYAGKLTLGPEEKTGRTSHCRILTLELASPLGAGHCSDFTRKPASLEQFAAQ